MQASTEGLAPDIRQSIDPGRGGCSVVFWARLSPKEGTLLSTSQPSPYLTRAQAAAYLNVNPRWLANEGKALVPFHRFGRMARYHLETLEQWARQQRVRTV